MWVNRLDGIHWFNFLVILASFEQISEVSHTLILPTHTGIWTLMCGWVSLCDVKKVNSKHWFFENQKYSYAVNQNKYKFLTRVKDIQTTSFFINTLAQTLSTLRKFLRRLIFTRPKISHFASICFCESALWKLFARIYFCEWGVLKYFATQLYSDI